MLGSEKFSSQYVQQALFFFINWLFDDSNMCVFTYTKTLPIFFFLSLQCVPVAGEETTENVAEASLNKEQHPKQREK